MKIGLSFIVLVISWLGFGQSSDLSGTYYVTHDGVVTNELAIVLRKNGTLKVTYNGYSPEKIVVLNPVKGMKAFESKLERGEQIRMDFSAEPYMFMVLDGDRAVALKTVLGKSKKEAKAGYKSLNGKAAKNPSMIMKNFGFKESEEKPPVHPMEVEYIASNPTSKFHEEHVGEIVFFSEKPTIGQEAPSKVKTDFKVGDEVWAAVYLPVPLSHYSGNDLLNDGSDVFGRRYGFLCVRMDNNDEELLPKEREIVNSAVMIDLNKEDFDKNCFVFLVVPNSSSEGGSDWITERMAERLGAFKHELTVTLTDGRLLDKNHLMMGTFNLDASENGTGVYAGISEQIKNAELLKKRVPTAVRRDAGIEAEMMQQVELVAHNRGWKNIEFTKAIITIDWQVIHDDLGDIKGKFIQGSMLFKSDEGCGYMEFGFLSDYLGGGRYADGIRQYSSGSRGPLSCDKVE